MRADARRNRDKLVSAAAEVFAEQAVETASLEEVARRAGVGAGTLYRHFPARANLVEAVYRQEVETLCTDVDGLLAENPPDVALAIWMERFVHYAAVKRGLIGAMRSAVADNSETFAHTHKLVHDTMSQLVGAAVAAGAIREDTDPEDLLRGLSGFCMFGDQDGWQDRAVRLIKMLIDGLRYGAPETGLIQGAPAGSR